MVEEKKHLTDEELVLKVVGFNANAFEQLYVRYSSFLYSLIKKIIGDPKLSEKVLLNIFAIFWKRIQYYDTATNNVYTYLTLLTRNRAIDILKRMDEHKVLPAYDDLYELEKIIPKLSPVIKPVSLGLAMTFSEKIRFHKAQLSEVQNLILNMTFFEGLTDDEIAKKLNVSEAAIKQKVQTTLSTLMQNISGKNIEAGADKKIIDLIKLEAIGRLSKDEKEYLDRKKSEDSEFPWAILGEYQNLVALLATTIVPESPPTDLSGEITKLFKNVLTGNTGQYDIAIVNKSTKSEISLNDSASKQDVLESPENFTIRLKKPSKQDLEIIKEISNIVPDLESIERTTEKKPTEKIVEPLAKENLLKNKYSLDQENTNVVKGLKKDSDAKKTQTFIREEEKTTPVFKAKDEKISDNVIELKKSKTEFQDKKPENKLRKDEHKTEKIIEDYKQTYEKETGKPRKKVLRNIMITVILILLLFGGGFAIYLSLQKEPAEPATKVEQPVTNQNIDLNSQNNLAQQTVQPVEQNDLQKTVPQNEQPKNEQPQNEQRKNEPIKKEQQNIVYSPLPAVPKTQKSVPNRETKQEASNTQNNIINDQSKTEKLNEEKTPPKEEKPITGESSYFVAVEEPPQPIGGIQSILQKVVYPEIAKKAGVQGKVYVLAFVDENGDVKEAKITKGIGAGCDEAALEAVKKTKFKPGKQGGKPVKVRVSIPIVFKL
ncbi:MAG: TonB family protein [Caldisericia bacterium]